MKALLSGFALLAMIACASARPPSPSEMPEHPQDAVMDVSVVPWDFIWRQAITAHYQDAKGSQNKGSFEAVLQKQGGRLTLVGLTPLGTRAFVAVQENTDVRVLEGDQQRLPFPPRFVFLDVNRCFLINLADPQAEGWHSSLFKGEQIQDLWQDGRLHERRMWRSDESREKPGIVIRYADGFRPGDNPGQVEIQNNRFNYRLQIRTLEAQNL